MATVSATVLVTWGALVAGTKPPDQRAFWQWWVVVLFGLCAVGAFMAVAVALDLPFVPKHRDGIVASGASGPDWEPIVEGVEGQLLFRLVSRTANDVSSVVCTVEHPSGLTAVARDERAAVLKAGDEIWFGYPQHFGPCDPIEPGRFRVQVVRAAPGPCVEDRSGRLRLHRRMTARGVRAPHPWGTRPARYGRTGALTCGDACRRTLLGEQFLGGRCEGRGPPPAATAWSSGNLMAYTPARITSPAPSAKAWTPRTLPVGCRRRA